MTWRLEEALDQLETIHAQVMRSEVFRGYRPAPMLATAVLAVVATLAQPWVPWALATPSGYVAWWLGIAGIAALVCAFDMWRAVREQHAAAVRQRTLPVITQFLPSFGVGLGLTVCWFAEPTASCLPGIWAIVFGLGVFGSRPYLPRAVGWIGLSYLLAGLVVLSLDGSAGTVPSPWSMGVPFGIGQAALAYVLHKGVPRGVPGSLAGLGGEVALDERPVDVAGPAVPLSTTPRTTPALEEADGNPA